MKKIIISLTTISALAVLIVGATGAFFSDTEVSVDNVLQAGALDLKIDSEAHYNGLICRRTDNDKDGYRWLEPVGSQDVGLQALEHYDTECSSSWPEKDLVSEKFFNFSDLKPGDWGENTISLHVYDNDAWGRFVVSDLRDYDNTCTEPEAGADDESCTVQNPEGDGSGELSEEILFTAWLDQGSIPGFQCVGPDGNPVTSCIDPQEGDNIQGPSLDTERAFWTGNVASMGTWNLDEVLGSAYRISCTNTNTFAINGHNGYKECQGLAADGRMVGSTTYYFGLSWEIGDDVGNIIQTDSLIANMAFEIEQYRNNPSPFPQQQ